MPKFSFITIAFNEEQYLNNLLNDLKAQDYPHREIEVILVDSNSTDSTKTIMKDFAKSNDFLRCCVLDNPKKVLACGWNIALKEASETEYWIEILIESGYLSQLKSEKILHDCREIIKLLTSIVKTT